MLNVGDLVKVNGTTVTGCGEEVELFPVGTTCLVTDISRDGFKYIYEVIPVDNWNHEGYWYAEEDLIKSSIIHHSDESEAMFFSDENALKDRKLFVHNLGVLLSQTREQILSAELDDNEIVTVTYKDGTTKRINVNMDSYLAIVKDVSLRV